MPKNWKDIGICNPSKVSLVGYVLYTKEPEEVLNFQNQSYI